MRIAFLADVHSNLEALTAVLEEIDREAPDRLIFLGDAVGYGPDPNACLEKILQVSDKAVAGNHDFAAIGRTSIESFIPYARESILWTRSALSRENRDKLSALPLTAHEGDLFLVHASPERPQSWSYIHSSADGAGQFAYFEGPVCLVGHTHRQGVYFHDGNRVLESRESILTFQENFRYIVNVGSVGQPRDGNPDAGYVLLETEDQRLSMRRVSYDFRTTQDKMRAANLPSFLINRLEYGE